MDGAIQSDRPFPYPEIAGYERLLLREEPRPWETPGDGEADAVGRCAERHLQCVWYSDRMRPGGLVADTGEPVAVESCGRWNLEAGPDFLDAVLFVGAERRRVVGDVELHVRPSGWTAHGHARDARYGRVVLHVTYHPGPRPADLPEGVLCVSLRDGIRAMPRFSFDDIDLAAYPHAAISETPRPCRAAWGGDPGRAIATLRSAGLYRLELKRRRMRAALRDCGDASEALYEATMGALGYKKNARAFRRLARALPLRLWTGDRVVDFARLLGVAGILPEMPPPDDPRAPLARRLWDAWWHNAADAPSPPIVWSFDAIRPQNAPFRRLAAAAAIFSAPRALADWLETVDASNPKFPAWIRDKIVALASFPEMEPVYSFAGKRGGPRPAALVGETRAAAVVSNAVLPYLAAVHPRKARPLFEKLPPETTSAPMRTMAARLFGPDHNPRALYEGNGILQQGLLQIYGDFCLPCKSDCAECAFGSGRNSF